MQCFVHAFQLFQLYDVGSSFPVACVTVDFISPKSGVAEAVNTASQKLNINP